MLKSRSNRVVSPKGQSMRALILAASLLAASTAFAQTPADVHHGAKSPAAGRRHDRDSAKARRSTSIRPAPRNCRP